MEPEMQAVNPMQVVNPMSDPAKAGFKLGVFSANADRGLTFSTVPEIAGCAQNCAHPGPSGPFIRSIGSRSFSTVGCP